MSVGRPTCGPLFAEALAQWAGSEPEKIFLFAAGHVHGQAEKVYLGACAGAMFRPAPEYREQLRAVVCSAAALYGILVGDLGAEIWLLRDEEAANDLAFIAEQEENSRKWHLLRGALCGVPFDEIDPAFHERRGYGERCEPNP